MGGFTEEEIAAELRRRSNETAKIEADRAEKARQDELSRCDTVCLMCCTPVVSYLTTDPENPLCDVCLGD